jgi:hypothetical protein
VQRDEKRHDTARRDVRHDKLQQTANIEHP